MGRLELPASSSQSWRAANCATPGYLVFHFPGSFRGFFVSVGIPVVTGKFPTKSTARQNRPFARVSRRSGLPQPTRWMPLSIIPKLARCQLRYTRISRFHSPGSFRGFFVSVGIPVVKPRFPTKFTPRQNHPFARVSRRSGLSLWEPWMPLSTIPKQARYQLRYTRLFFDTRRILTHTGALCNAFFVAISFGLC